MSFSLDNYTPVSERILDFYKQYPAGVITTQPAKIIDIAGSTFVSVVARVYLDRHMDDAPMSEGEAWEPYPGKTPYTRDSEQMNAATSAIGRALMQLGIGITESGGASREEVANRQTDAPKWEGKYPAGEHRGSMPATENQVKAVVATLKRLGIDRPFWGNALTARIGRDIDAPESLFKGEIDQILRDKGESLRAAYFGTMGLTITAKGSDPIDGDDIWAGERLG